MLRGGELIHIHPNLGEKIGRGYFFNPRDGGTQGHSLLRVTELFLNLGFELGDLRLQELSWLLQHASHPAMVLRHPAVQSQPHSGQLGAQAAPRQSSEFFGILFASQELGENGAARHS